MKKNIKLPAPPLSQLKEVNIDLDMTGRHYAWIATSGNAVPEDIALSILQDLMDEDANKLNIAELRYLFTLVKINSLEDDYTFTTKCTHMVKGKVCGCENTFDLHLSDADLHMTPNDYKVPEIQFRTKDTEQTYQVMPPTMDMESALYNWFLVAKGKTISDIANDINTSLEYTFIRACLHLVDKEGNRLIKEENEFEYALTLLDCNKYKVVDKLYKLCAEVDSFGVQNPEYHMKCKECGGNIDFHLPFFYGLID